jgi:purine nucleosidase
MWETGLEGFGILSKSEMKLPSSYFGIEENGIDLLIKTIHEYSNNIDIISIGQFSNIATALTKEPDITEKISHIWSMSAGVSFIDPIPHNFPSPNKTYKAIPSHNIRIDKQAAKMVLDSHIPITFIGNDVTTKILFYENQISKVEANGTQLDQAVMDMARIWLKYRSRRLEQDEIKTCLHDALVVAESMGMNFTKKVPISIKIDEFGGTEIEYKEGSIYDIAYSVNSDSFMDWYIETITN